MRINIKINQLTLLSTFEKECLLLFIGFCGLRCSYSCDAVRPFWFFRPYIERGVRSVDALYYCDCDVATFCFLYD